MGWARLAPRGARTWLLRIAAYHRGEKGASPGENGVVHADSCLPGRLLLTWCESCVEGKQVSMDVSPLFRPLRVRNKELRNRIVMPPMVVLRDLTAADGVDWYGRRAR